jgi:hypothetical protein
MDELNDVIMDSPNSKESHRTGQAVSNGYNRRARDLNGKVSAIPLSTETVLNNSSQS